MLSHHIESQIYDKFPYEPTIQQKKLIKILSKFVAGEDSNQIFVLNGYAGTGKTTIISALSKCLNTLNIKCILMAPTGRAAKVISNYSGNNAVTIHKKIFRQKSSTENKFILTHNKDKGSIYIIDESSMIANSSFDNNIFGSGELLNDIFKYVESGSNCKVIFVGDSAQLPPIGTNLSPALDPSELDFFGATQQFEMNEIVRQTQLSGILYNATLIRQMINNNEIEIPKFQCGFDDFIRVGGSDILEVIEDNYSKYGRSGVAIITKSNKQANRFNNGIRARVLYQEEEIESGDQLMIVKNNYFYNLTDEEDSSKKSEEFIANGDVAQIKRIRRYEEIHGFRFADVTLKLTYLDDFELDCKILLDTLQSESPSITPTQQKQLFESVERDYAHLTRKPERYKAMRNDPYLNALQVKFAYAITCHKAQGGEWDTVIIDQMLWGEQQMSIEMLRWLYTAITRATKRVYLLNFDDRFFL